MPPFFQLHLHAEKCHNCGLCVRECDFLQKHGSPGIIASSWQPETVSGQHLPFACNLCGLCAKICPSSVGLDPTAMFLEMRQQIVKSGAAPFREHKRLLAYQGRGFSKRYSCSVLPNNCDTVLFPGCGFAGTRPARLLELFEHLRQDIPSLGIVLSCCAKPSHDLGQQIFFMSMFNKLRQFLLSQDVRRVLVLCPSCHAIFKQYGFPLQTEYVYTLLAQHRLPEHYALDGDKKVTIHDPCTTRQDNEVHYSVRKLLRAASLEIEEMPHHGSKTLCCGEGGGVPFIEKKIAQRWGDRRQVEADGRITVTYCTGCVDFLRSRLQIVHLLDLIFTPKAGLAGRAKIARPPFTYLNRLCLKQRLT